MHWWIWFVLGLVLLIFEMATPGGFYFIFFGVSALVVGFLAIFGVTSDWMEWLLFSVFAVGSTAFFRKPLLKRLGAYSPSRDVDTLIGEVAQALEGIQPGAYGKAELRGSAWNACNTGRDVLVQGQRCRVERVDGLTLFIRNAEAEPPPA